MYLRHHPPMQRLDTALQPIKHALLRLSRPTQVHVRLVSIPHELESHVCAALLILRQCVVNDTVQTIIA